MLWQAVYALPMAQRTAVVLYYREGLAVEEVAKAMGVSPSIHPGLCSSRELPPCSSFLV